MKKTYNARNLLIVSIISLFFVGCAPISKFASFRQPYSSENYTLEVVLLNRIPATYALSINKSHVVDLIWSDMSYEKEVTGTYLGKEVVMKGHYYPGPRTVIDVEIAGEKASQFDFIF